MKVTRWLNGDPERPGVYERKGFFMSPCYARWDGRWMTADYTVAGAADSMTPSLIQTGHKYRGLAAPA